MNGLVGLVICAIAAACVSSVLGQELANRPELSAGDLWIFHQTGDDDGRPINNTWRRRIEEVLPGDRIRVAPHYSTDLFDTSWNPILRNRPDFPLLDFRFPLSVGASWSYTSPSGAMSLDGRGYEHTGSMKVVAYESISVPAGTFKCFRIEGESTGNIAVDSAWPDWRFTNRWRVTNWFCPDVGYIGKSRIERYSGGSFRKGALRVTDSELIRYRWAGALVASAKGARERADKPWQPSPFEGSWEGQQGIWRVAGRVSGDHIEGTIRCRRNDKWSGRAAFAGAIAEDGSVDAETVDDKKGWAPRQVVGKFPSLRVVGYGKLDCPDGEVTVKKVD